MCDGASAVMVISAVVAAAGTYAQAQNQEKATRKAAEYNAQVAENEAATQKELAQNEIARGVADRERQQRAAARQMGEMRAGMGASGFQMDTGTMASLLEESATEHQYDSNIITGNSEQAAWQHLVGRTGALNNMNFANWQAASAKDGRAGTYLGMGSTILGGVAQGMYMSAPSTPDTGPDYLKRTFGQSMGGGLQQVRHPNK